MQLFEYVIIFHERQTAKDKDEGKRQKSIMISKGIKTIMAKDEKEVLLLAAGEIPPEYKEQLDQVEVAVRPF